MRTLNPMRIHSAFRRSHSTRSKSRRAAFSLSTVALAAPLTLLGVNPGVAAPETPTDSPHGLSEGIDDEALRHRLLHEEAAPSASAEAVRVTEQESAGQSDDNDQFSTAERLRRPQDRHDGQLRIDGSLSTEVVEPEAIEPNQENDGAIPLARDLELGEDRRGISTTGHIGDGPHGSEGDGTGDFDFYRLEASAGDTLTIDVAPDGELIPNALLYDADGNLLIGAQDMTGETGEAHLSYPIEHDGDFYVAVGAHYPADPFEAGSGPGAISEGPYQLDATLHSDEMADTDVFALPLRKGDVLGATVSGSAGRVAIHEHDGELLQASAVDSTPIYPDDSPLPGGGNATADHVVDKTGIYFLTVSDGSGDYSASVGVHRAPSTTGERPQTIYLDFTGPTFDNRVFGAAALEPGIRDLSPMRAFLPAWGLATSDERAVIEATTERVEQILRDDIPGSKVRVVNSLERPDMFGEPGVSRVIIGGTVEESGIIPAFGLSESIDPGNFVREETAIVMPELMSTGEQPPSLNAFLTEDSDRVDAVAKALGNTTAHEIGHFLGNFHTDDHDEHTNVMNTGNLLHMYAIGEDGAAGTADDDVITMGTSRYDPLQGQSGTESTPKRTGAALR